MRAKIRTKFERYRHVTDVAVLDILLHKGHTEYQETMNAWKQAPHVMQWFREEEAPGTYGPLTNHAAKPETFLGKFYATRDEGRGPTHEGL